MEAVGALVALAPIALVLLVLWRTMRRTVFRWERRPLLPPTPLPPPAPGPDELAGDRVPRRPLQPSLSGAAALPMPEAETDDEPAAIGPTVIHPRGEPGTFGIAS